MKNLLFLFTIISILFLSSQNNQTNNSNQKDNKNTKKSAEKDLSMKIYRDMKFHQKNTITKDEFKSYLRRILTNNNPIQGSLPYHDELIERFVEEVPDVFPTKDLMKYSDFSKFVSLTKDIVKNQYGAEYVEKIDSKMKETKLDEL
jgi:hypothetical protein